MDNKPFSIVSFNMHGFNQGHSTLNYLCSASDLNINVILSQENWLTPGNLHKIKAFSPRYVAFGISAMESDIGKGVLRGRPRGGVCTLINLEIASTVTFNKCAERYVALCLGQLLIINVYFPSIASVDDLCIVQSMFAEIEVIINSFPNHKLVMGGDFNTNIGLITAKNDIFRHFLVKFKIVPCNKIIDCNLHYTYCHESLQQFSCIDFICVSSDIVSTLQEFKVLDLAFNLSDHLPVYTRLSIDLIMDSGVHGINNCPPINDKRRQYKLRWDHAKSLPLYYECTRNLLMPLFNRLSAESYRWLDLFNKSNTQSNDCIDVSSSQSLSAKYSTIDRIHEQIEQIYEQLVSSLNQAATQNIPSCKSDFFKHWWSQENSELKIKSCSTHSDWVNAGKPLHGPYYNAKRTAKAAYKKCIKDKQQFERETVSNDLHDALVNKSTAGFWKSWHNKFGNKTKSPPIIQGLSDANEIAEQFAKYFSDVCNTDNSSNNMSWKSSFHSRMSTYSGSSVNEFTIDTEMIDRIVRNLGRGKSSGLDQLTAEHIQFSHPIVINILAMLLNLLIKLEFVPKAFGIGVIIPIPKKDSKSNHDRLSDYRGITISPVISNIFELCILENIKDLLTTSDLQFGFKTGLSCAHAIYSVRSTVNYFTSNCSTVNLCSLDITKAFDRVNHHVLFLKLMDRNIPRKLISLLFKWYSNSTAVVRWNSYLSNPVKILAGVRQGGVLSPFFFSIFVDEILIKLKLSHLGCQIHAQLYNAIMYADDLLLLSISLSDLQEMVNICVREFNAIGLSINISKSACMRIGTRFKTPVANIRAGNSVIEWKSELQFLGISLLAASTVKCNLQRIRQKFFRSLNGIFGKIGAHSSTSVTLSLVSTFCVPLLTYGIEAFNVNNSAYNVLESAYSAAFSKIFNSYDKNVIKQCQFFCNTSPLCDIIDNKRLKFYHGISKTKNVSLRILFLTSGQQEFNMLLSKHRIAFESSNCWKHIIWSNFSESTQAQFGL